jgi:hypothetical protein
MKKFSELKYKNIDTKKYHNKTKDNLYSIIKENIYININSNYPNSIIENVNIDLNGIDNLINKLDKFIEDKKNEEKIKVLESIKASFATGTLSLKRINEEIQQCECTEVCVVPGDESDDKTTINNDNDNEFIDDYDDDLDNIDTTSEYRDIE